MQHIAADQYLPSGRGKFTVRGVAEALEFMSLAIVTMKKAGNANNIIRSVVLFS